MPAKAVLASRLSRMDGGSWHGAQSVRNDTLPFENQLPGRSSLRPRSTGAVRWVSAGAMNSNITGSTVHRCRISVTTNVCVPQIPSTSKAG